MRERIRTFIAVEVDSYVRQRALDLMDILRTAQADVKWVEPENLHITIKFLGEVLSRDIYHICQAVQKAVAQIEPFPLVVAGAGAFPDVIRPRTIWLGLSEGEEQLARLQRSVEDALLPLGFPREGRPFKAHLTLGRVRRASPGLARLAQLLRDQASFSGAETFVEEVVVFSSELTPEGPIYEPLATLRLQGK
ncbi:MAG: RNA 2',3'-cyclic phosphodiesterase [Thermoguttaceae bacterium]|nr:RNA 2',3'-cyclic phosphodiesterase [Thermoguttaceae bacterium]MDW8079906.1 RNA 2',3'-cyclic phosphodiesterase [Thermoguttaceae bacterium]